MDRFLNTKMAQYNYLKSFNQVKNSQFIVRAKSFWSGTQ